MTREEAIKTVRNIYQTDAEKEALETLIPELKESEDEKTRRGIIQTLEFACAHKLVGVDDVLKMKAYLEKQKHSLNFDAISSWLRDRAIMYVNSEYNEFHHCIEYDGTINVERLIVDLEVAVDSGTFDIHEQKEQKPEWSEEDERMLSRCIKSVECSKQFADSETYKAAKDVEMNWLKSLPERFNLQPKQVWSEEDDEMLESFLHKLEVCDLLSNKENVWAIRRLKSLRPQPKQEWSEEDEMVLKDIEVNFKFNKGVMTDDLINQYDKFFAKIRSIRPKSKADWSEEQEKRFKRIVEYIRYKGYEDDAVFIESLRPQ